MSFSMSIQRRSRSRAWVLAFGLALCVAGHASAAVDLGEAGNFAMLGLGGAKLCMSHQLSGVNGNVGLGPLAIQNFSNGFINGTYYVDPTANNSHSNNVVFSGGTVIQDLSGAVMDALDAAAECATLLPTQTFHDINKSTTILGNGGENVIRIHNISLNGGAKLKLKGTATDSFIIQVTGSIKITHKLSSIEVDGGVDPANVLFCLSTHGDALSMSGGSHAVGTFLAPDGKVALGVGYVEGRVIAGGDICLPSGGQITLPPQGCPCAFDLQSDKADMADFLLTNFGTILDPALSQSACKTPPPNYPANPLGLTDQKTFIFQDFENIDETANDPQGGRLVYWVDQVGATNGTCNVAGRVLDGRCTDLSEPFFPFCLDEDSSEEIFIHSMTITPDEAVACRALLNSLCPP